MENYSSLVAKQKSFFYSGKTKDISFRIEALQKLRTAIQNYEKDLLQSLKIDLNKSEFEAFTTAYFYFP